MPKRSGSTHPQASASAPATAAAAGNGNGNSNGNSTSSAVEIARRLLPTHEQVMRRAKRERARQKRGIGQPERVTTQVLDAICQTIRTTGVSHRVAALAHGIGLSTLYAACQRHPEYMDALQAARAQCEIGLAARVHDGEKWHSAAFILERTRPDDWAKREFLAIDAGTLRRMDDGALSELVPQALDVLSPKRVPAGSIEIEAQPVESAPDGATEPEQGA